MHRPARKRGGHVSAIFPRKRMCIACNSHAAGIGGKRSFALTHEVTNQSPPLSGSSAWRTDPLLVQLADDFTDPVRKDLDQLGRYVRSVEAQDLARLANS